MRSYRVEDEGQRQEKDPEIQVKGVAEDLLLRVVEPASGQRSPYPLEEDVQNVRSHGPVAGRDCGCAVVVVFSHGWPLFAADLLVVCLWSGSINCGSLRR